MLKQKVVSSWIKNIYYDEDGSILKIELIRGGFYEYANVPRHIYDEMICAFSVGKYFNKYISSRYKLWKQDYINDCEVDLDGSEVNIKKLYYKLVHEFHPDLELGCEEMMKIINEHYEDGNYYELKLIANRCDIELN